MAFEDLHTKYVADAIDLPPAADLIAMLDDGETYETLAETFDCHPSTIATRVTRSGLRAQTPVPASTPGTVTDVEDETPPASSSTSPLPLLGAGEFPTWMARGTCHQTDPELFFPEKGGSTREAKKICTACPVQAECLDYALDNDERFGIWGGLSERERRKVKRAMQDAAGQVRVACPRCSQDFENAAALATHVRVHDRTDVACPHCDHVGKGAAGLAVHIHHSHPDFRNAS